nr:hypothetical protein CFP56_76181 [Quercus suber]
MASTEFWNGNAGRNCVTLPLVDIGVFDEVLLVYVDHIAAMRVPRCIHFGSTVCVVRSGPSERVVWANKALSNSSLSGLSDQATGLLQSRELQSHSTEHFRRTSTHH